MPTGRYTCNGNASATVSCLLSKIMAVGTSPPPVPVIGRPANQPPLGLSLVRLNLASRPAPARTNTPTDTSNTQNASVPNWTPPMFIPVCKTSIAGATPKATRSAIESNSAPNADVALSSLAVTPSITSSRPHQTIIQPASSRSPSCVVTIAPTPRRRHNAVKLLGIE